MYACSVYLSNLSEEMYETTCEHLVYLIAGRENHQLRRIEKNRATSLHQFPTANPNIDVQPLSMDPANKDYLAFTLLNHTTGEEIGRFRADDFAQMRSFMVALGATGQNFFSPRNETGAAVSVEATHGLWDVIHPSEDELAQRELAFQQTEKKNSSNAVRPPDAPPSYATTYNSFQ